MYVCVYTCTHCQSAKREHSAQANEVWQRRFCSGSITKQCAAAALSAAKSNEAAATSAFVCTVVNVHVYIFSNLNANIINNISL